MKRLERIGAAVFDLLAVAVLLSVSFFLVFPFLTVLTGVVDWFQAPAGERELVLVFRSIRSHWKCTLPYGTALFLATGVAALDIAFFRQYAYPGSDFVLVLAWILIVFAFVTVVNGPTILNRMRVSFPALVYDALVVAAASPIDFLIAASLHAAVVVAAILVPALAVLLAVPAVWFAARFTLHAYRKLESSHNQICPGGNNE